MPRKQEGQRLMSEGTLTECLEDLKDALNQVRDWNDLERLLNGALEGIEKRKLETA